MSRPSDPVETTWMPCRAWESIFMMEPLPNCFSIWARAACSALALPSSMTFPSLTIGLSLILNVAADVGAAPRGRRNRNKISASLSPPHVSHRGCFAARTRGRRRRLTWIFIQYWRNCKPHITIKDLRLQLGLDRGEAHRNPPRPEGLLELLEAPGDRRPAFLAPSVLGDFVAEDAVPVARDHCAAAPRAVGRAAFRVVHVACIHVAQAVLQGDLARAGQGRCRRRGNVGHLVVGVEGGEMQRHVGSELLGDPAALGGDFLIAVVLARGEERGDFEPDLGLVLEVDERIEHVLQMRAAGPGVELFTER